MKTRFRVERSIHEATSKFCTSIILCPAPADGTLARRPERDQVFISPGTKPLSRKATSDRGRDFNVHG
jgi:hypothetical protein